MSFHRKPTEFELQQATLLGAHVSDSHTEFKEWAMMESDTAFIVWIMENPNASLIDMLKTYSKLEFLKGTNEVTKLAMIVGSRKTKVNVRDEVDRIRGTVPSS